MDSPDVKYTVGDLLWAKIGNYPFWPCMVSYDPIRCCYFERKKVRSVDTIIYHVQYFGKQAQHGWTAPGAIFPFEGEQAYYNRKKELVRGTTSASIKKKIKMRYSVASAIHEAWIIAIREAEGALDLKAHERFECFVFLYENNLKSNGQIDATKKVKNKGESKKPTKLKDSDVWDEKKCKFCDKGKADLSCSGPCKDVFHKECLGLITRPTIFTCFNCERGFSKCFICKVCDVSPVKCSKCDNYYHKECLMKFKCADIEKNICSYHTCLTCHNENPRNVSSKGPFMNCIHCPTTFHSSLQCIPVGSVKVSQNTMICPEHFLGKNKVSPQGMSNFSYCTVCSEGGELICCESCPNAFHVKCINTTEVPTGDFFCEDCVNRQYLYVGMIVWAKTGNYRWWPAQIVNNDELPLNVKNLGSYAGEFPIQFFGTDEYFWIHRGKVFPYGEHHKDYFRTGSKQCRLDSYFKISLEEASEAYDQYINNKRMRSLTGQRDAYKPIKVNRAVPPAQITTLSNKIAKNILPCSCNPNKPYPCGPESGCLNRTMLMECHPDVCPAGDRCENMKFQRRQYAKVKVIKTPDRGWGLQTNEFIGEGRFVIEYVGEVITHEEYRRRIVEMRQKDIQNYYFLYLDSRRMIDAGPKGNLSRFINHSCYPNCEMVKWSVNGDSRIGIFALSDIEPGDELTFNYQSDSVQFEQKCRCGAPNCQGYIGKNIAKHKSKKLKTK